MDQFEYRLIEDERASIFQIALGDRRETLAVPKPVQDHPRIGASMIALANALDGFGTSLAKRAGDLSEAGFKKEAERLVKGDPAQKFNEATRAVLDARTDLEKREAFWFPVRFDDDTPPAVRAEIRGWARKLKLPELFAAAEADPVLAAAIVEGGQVRSGLTPDLFERVREVALSALGTERMLSQGAYRTEPTPDDPVGGKPDIKLAREQASQVIDGLRNERELLDTVPRVLAQVVTAVALMMDQRREAAFGALTAQ